MRESHAQCMRERAKHNRELSMREGEAWDKELSMRESEG